MTIDKAVVYYPEDLDVVLVRLEGVQQCKGFHKGVAQLFP